MYTPVHFRIEELVPPDMHARWRHAPHKLFMLFDMDALRTLDALRHRYGPIVVNNWHTGGQFRNSGWRAWDCPEGAALSQHKLGRAFDCKFTRISAAKVRQDMEREPEAPCFAAIRRIEAFDGMSWFHFDTGNHDREGMGVLVVGGPSGKAKPVVRATAGSISGGAAHA
jgi:hypothetical protein